MLLEIISDAFFAAIAAIGFAAISSPTRRAFFFCAVIAAAGHSLRYVLMMPGMKLNIVVSTFIAAFVMGIMAVKISSYAKMPPETCLFSALLPMIPGIYAYKSFGGMAMSVLHSGDIEFSKYFYIFADNGLMCVFIILGMVVGATIPVFAFKKKTIEASDK